MKKKNIICLLLFSTLNFSLLTFNSFGQWVQQSVPVTSGQFFDMKFANANTGFIAHSTNVLLKTTDAGYNWVVNKNGRMSSISIVDSQYIYGPGYNNLTGKLYKTTNGGLTWDSLLSSYGYSFWNTYFFNRNTGFISSGNGTDNQIWRTTDGGQTKQLITSYGGATQGNIFFLKEKVDGEYYGWMYYQGGSQLRATTNSGLTWNSLPDFSNTEHLNSIFFVSKDTGWATTTSYTNYIYMTTNGGLNWVNKILPYNAIHYDIYFVNPNTGWVGFSSYNRSYTTTNAGTNWGTQWVYGNGSAKLFFSDSITGWAQTSWNTISHTTNGGGPITSAISNYTVLSPDYQLNQNYPNPFNPSTSIKYYLKSKSFVELKIYDVSGKEVVNLVNSEQNAGRHEIKIDFTNHPSGTYFYRLVTRNKSSNTFFSETKRMIFLK